MRGARLSLSQTLSFPLQIATESISLLARKGAGKTYTIAVLLEELAAALSALPEEEGKEV